MPDKFLRNNKALTSSHGTWTCVELGGRACHLFEPTTQSEHGYTVLYLHDSGEQSLEALQENKVFCSQFNRHGLRVIAPSAGTSWWSDKPLPGFGSHPSCEQYVVKEVVPFVAERWQVAPPRLALLGVGMGGQGALRLSYKHPNIFPVVAAISPAIDFQTLMQDSYQHELWQLYEDPEQARQDTATLHIHPLNWPRNQWFCTNPENYRWFESADRLRMKLYSLGVPFESDLETVVPAQSNHNDQMASQAIEYLATRCESERLRVV